MKKNLNSSLNSLKAPKYHDIHAHDHNLIFSFTFSLSWHGLPSNWWRPLQTFCKEFLSNVVHRQFALVKLWMNFNLHRNDSQAYYKHIMLKYSPRLTDFVHIFLIWQNKTLGWVTFTLLLELLKIKKKIDCPAESLECPMVPLCGLSFVIILLCSW